MDWQVANATAMMRATQVHRDLGIDRTSYVDVFAALQAGGIDCIARPLPRLFGFYVARSDGGPGVLLNASLDEIDLRHTAAHELGHHAFGHGSRSDTDLDRAGTLPERAWSPEEKQAESFAAWFLMPPPAVEAGMRRIGVDRITNPHEAYELARWLGTSYAGTVRHLGRLKKISRQTANKWSGVAPSHIRARLYGAATPRPSSHVFALRSQAHGGVLHVSAGDLITPLFRGSIEQLPSGLRLANDSEVAADTPRSDAQELFGLREIVPQSVEVTDKFSTTAALTLLAPGHDEPFTVTLVPVIRRFGLDKVWQEQHQLDATEWDSNDQ